jgi:hypothetical protein
MLSVTEKTLSETLFKVITTYMLSVFDKLFRDNVPMKLYVSFPNLILKELTSVPTQPLYMLEIIFAQPPL